MAFNRAKNAIKSPWTITTPFHPLSGESIKMTTNGNGNDHKYFLEHDGPEHDRLTFQHRALLQMLHGQAIHAPLQAPAKILDIGCGTGVMTVLLAKRFPAAHVIGVDLAPVPEAFTKPDNVTYMQGSFSDLVSTGKLEKGSFDFVFSRMLVFGIQDWNSYVKNVAALLKHGGWTEMQDLDTRARNRDSILAHQDNVFEKTMVSVMADQGMDATCGINLPTYMTSAGLQVGGHEFVPWVLKSFKSRPETELMAQHTQSGSMTTAVVLALEKMMASERYSRELVKEAQESVKSLWGNAEDGEHMRYYICYAQKP
ncbi:hypothetical protein LTR62_006463 [Meristemomyces frigidus]|uniref:Methyltransferase domain-containing protein n=1 Tax=Meristemomyces frigidus TaxID=1508187 RepID=A0AAN7YIH2_9PEZI|nr:hypothetical protein LTR62_006463 [Meristemomyces frigidus]